MKRTLAALFIPAALLLASCSSPEPETATAPATSVEASCPKPLPITDPGFAAAVNSVELPTGASVTTGRLSASSDHPGMQAAAIDICDPAVKSADDLRPIATEYAKALKASPLADKIFSVYVASYQQVGNDVTGEVKLKDPDFQLHLWNGKPSEAAELKNWDVVVG